MFITITQEAAQVSVLIEIFIITDVLVVSDNWRSFPVHTGSEFIVVRSKDVVQVMSARQYRTHEVIRYWHSLEPSLITHFMQTEILMLVTLVDKKCLPAHRRDSYRSTERCVLSTELISYL